MKNESAIKLFLIIAISVFAGSAIVFVYATNYYGYVAENGNMAAYMICNFVISACLAGFLAILYVNLYPHTNG